jgi:hypothetical protein
MAKKLGSRGVPPAPPRVKPVRPAQAGLILVNPADPLPYGTPIPENYDVKPGFAHPKPGLTPRNPRSIGTR